MATQLPATTPFDYALAESASRAATGGTQQLVGDGGDCGRMTGGESHNDNIVVGWSALEKWPVTLRRCAMQRKFPQLRVLHKSIGLDIPKGAVPESPLFPSSPALNEKICLWYGDITTLKVDAIVNAAHSWLTGGGGVDGAIHSAAGPDLVAECLKLDGCAQGEAKLTGGYKLPAKYIIHTVGPLGENSPILSSCYHSSLCLARERGIRTLAFCCISTGHYKYPTYPAAHIALCTARKWLEDADNASYIDGIVFCVNTVHNEVAYEDLMPIYFP
ncbi:O-acetyl-ADP-ribose deacetylase MACROD1 [Pelomyxa schiedti]|nr:O-acetyl-ADP-ribose deacetylase MACROD1 [Pelomyxa schiedti]